MVGRPIFSTLAVASVAGCLVVRMCMPFEWTVRSGTASSSFTLHLLPCTCIPGMGIYVLALCVFLMATFPLSWVLSRHENDRKTKMAVVREKSLSF